MNFKNILLGMVAVILSICLAFLLFIATNQNALAKVHQTISTFSKMNNVSSIEKTLNITINNTAKASEKDASERKAEVRYNKVDINKNSQTKSQYSSEECKIIAQNYAESKYGKRTNINPTNETNQNITYMIEPNSGYHNNEISVDKTGKIETMVNSGK
ncbi:hypothetical protein HYI43_10180 [Staphylococcus taiwanensis]|nr:hypothetical protein HYI43_10180 [Staphylococcus taiwanensis]